MDRSRALSRLLLALPALAAAAGASLAQPPSPPIAERVRERLAVVDSLAAASRLDTALVVLQSALRETRRRGDRASLGALVQAEGELIERRGGDPQKQAREALGLTMAGRDTTGMMAALALLGPRPVDHDGLVEPAVEWLLRIALDRDDRRFESRARSIIGAGWLADGQTETARRSYARALELARLAGDWRAELTAVTGLGRVAFAMGDLDRAREAHRKVARIATDRHADPELGRALRDLARIEVLVGDLDAAVEEDLRAWAALRRVEGTSDWIEAALEAASIETHLDLEADAETTLVHVSAECESLGLAPCRARALAQRSEALVRARKPAEAAAVARQGLALGRALPLPERARLAVALATALADQDSAAASLELLDRELRASGRRLPPASRMDLETARAERLETMGRAREALDAYARARRAAPSSPAWRAVSLLAGMARVERAQGRSDRAAARLDEAARAWAAEPEAPSDLGDREAHAHADRTLRSLLVALSRPGVAGGDSLGRLRAAFDTLQAARNRAVIEGTLGPRGLVDPPAALAAAPLTADSLQHSVLREGELLLDLWLGAPSSFLFAVTRDSLRCVDLPGDRELIRRVRAHAALVSKASSTADPAAWDSSSARLGASILGGVTDLIAASRRILLASDGELAALPVGSLVVQGVGQDAPLGTTRPIERLPSASWLAFARGPRDEKARGVLALAGPDDEEGTARPSAAAAIEDLRSRYRDVRAETAERSETRITPERLAGAALVHFVTRTRLDDHHPWFSGLLVERPSATEGDPWWRAFQVAGSRVGARLVVLPACEPARAHAAAESGALAMATSLLAAGADAVIVNLWPVDPASSTRWTNAFYAGLARGETAAQALVTAQSAVRADPASRAPYYWAGFVLYGNGDVRIPLRSRPRWWWPSIAGAGVVIAALALVVGTRRRRKRGDAPAL